MEENCLRIQATHKLVFLESDPSFWFFFGDHELMDSTEDSPELLIIFLFKLLKFAGEVLVRRKNFSQFHKCLWRSHPFGT